MGSLDPMMGGAAQPEWVIKATFSTTTQENAHAHTPMDLDDLAKITEGAIGKLAAKASQLAEVSPFRIRCHAPFEEMHRHVFIPFSLRIPQHGGFHGRNIVRLHGVDLIIAPQKVAWKVGWLVAEKLNADQGFHQPFKGRATHAG
jgi:hypothetical protein